MSFHSFRCHFSIISSFRCHSIHSNLIPSFWRHSTHSDVIPVILSCWDDLGMTLFWNDENDLRMPISLIPGSFWSSCAIPDDREKMAFFHSHPCHSDVIPSFEHHSEIRNQLKWGRNDGWFEAEVDKVPWKAFQNPRDERHACELLRFSCFHLKSLSIDHKMKILNQASGQQWISQMLQSPKQLFWI